MLNLNEAPVQQFAPVPSKPLYQIKKRGKLVLQFRGSYDQARIEARKLVRKAVKQGRALRKGLWDSVSRNPTSLKAYGYRIVRVNG